MGVSSFFKRLRKAIRSKKKSESKDHKETKPTVNSAKTPNSAGLKSTTFQQSTASQQKPLVNSIPPGESDGPGSKSAISQPPTSSQPSITPESKRAVSQSTPARETSRPGSVTLAERIRYQKIVLGMSDAEIANALPPGMYNVVSPSTEDGPGGQGDLAYAYREPAR